MAMPDSQKSKWRAFVTETPRYFMADLATFANHPVGIVIAGRSIVAAKDPLSAAAEMQQAIGEVWPP